MPTTSRPLRVSGRAVADYWGVSPMTLIRASEADLLPELDDGGYDAEEALRLGRLPFVDPRDLAAFPPHSILFVQQTSFRHTDDDDPDEAWRLGYGWRMGMDPKDALDSASGWWPLAEHRRAGVLAVVSAVATFVVTIGVVDQSNPVRATSGNKIALNVSAPDEEDPLGRKLLRTFAGRRMPTRAGSSFLIPDVHAPE